MTRISDPPGPGSRLLQEDDEFVKQQRKRLQSPDPVEQDAARATLEAYSYDAAIAYTAVLLRSMNAVEQDANAVIECVHSTFARVFCTYTPDMEFGRYLKQSLINARNDIGRKVVRLREVPMEEEHFELPQNELDAADALIRRIDVSGALRRLSPEMRDALYLRFVEGRKYCEMAIVLDVGVTTAHVRVHKALRRLKELLGNYEIEGDHNVE